MATTKKYTERIQVNLTPGDKLVIDKIADILEVSASAVGRMLIEEALLQRKNTESQE